MFCELMMGNAQLCFSLNCVYSLLFGVGSHIFLFSFRRQFVAVATVVLTVIFLGIGAFLLPAITVAFAFKFVFFARVIWVPRLDCLALVVAGSALGYYSSGANPVSARNIVVFALPQPYANCKNRRNSPSQQLMHPLAGELFRLYDRPSRHRNDVSPFPDFPFIIGNYELAF
jgi:hypothetical protein